jgi:hypothetical protein
MKKACGTRVMPTGSRRKRPTKGQLWYASLTPAGKAAWVSKKQAEKANRAKTWEHREAEARLDLAEERHCFMGDIPDADVAKRMGGG